MNGRYSDYGFLMLVFSDDPSTNRVVGVHFQLESAPVIGVALEPARDGLVWVLINPQQPFHSQRTRPVLVANYTGFSFNLDTCCLPYPKSREVS